VIAIAPVVIVCVHFARGQLQGNIIERTRRPKLLVKPLTAISGAFSIRQVPVRRLGGLSAAAMSVTPAE
jgi:hypothetical protein